MTAEYPTETIRRVRLLLAFQEFTQNLLDKGIRDNECVSILHLGIKVDLADACSYAAWMSVGPEMAARWLANYEVPTDKERAMLAEFLITEAEVHLRLLTDAPVF